MNKAAYPKFYERLRFKYSNVFSMPAVFFFRYFKRSKQLGPAKAKFVTLCFQQIFIKSPLRCKIINCLCQLCYD